MTGQAPAFVASLGTEKRRRPMVGRRRLPLPALVPMAGRAKQYQRSCNALVPLFIGCADHGLSGTIMIRAPWMRLQERNGGSRPR